MSLRSLAPKQMQTLTRDILKPLRNVFILIPYFLLTKSNLILKILLNRLISSCNTQRYWCQSISPLTKIRLAKPIANSVSVDLVILEEDFGLRVEKCMIFLLELSYTTTQAIISHFQVKITNIVKHLDHFYCYCSNLLIL